MHRTATMLLLTLATALLSPTAEARTKPAGHAAPSQPHPSGELTLKVDLRDPAQRIYRVEERIPVSAGALTLYYPKWIPGEHSPSGPLNAVAGLLIYTDHGERLQWQRDYEDSFCIHVTVPAGAHTLQLEFQLLSPSSGGDFGHIVWASDQIEAVEWNQVVFYPSGAVNTILVRPRVLLPKGWSYGSALQAAETRDGDVEFEPVTLDVLVDSPVVAGLNFSRLDLAPGAAAPVHLNVIADDPEDLGVSDAQLQALRSLVNQAQLLFGTRHYRHYDFLLTLSDQLGNFGLEHAQSSDDRSYAKYFKEPDITVNRGFLLPHEFVHSWNGKYRQPAGLATPNYNVPMRGNLLWVYEGLTAYLDKVLTARSGIWTDAQFREALAATAADMDHRPGRLWRSVQDTADSGPTIYYSADEWASQRRGTDFYSEGALLWLDVDTKIRELSADKHSIDDFARAFCGQDPDVVAVKPYRFEDVIAALEGVQKFDWTHFLRERLDSHAAIAPIGGIAASGWKLIYNDVPNENVQALESTHKLLDLTDSLGLIVSTAPDSLGKVLDVLWNGPAFISGFAPGMRILAINTRAFDSDRVTQALRAAQDHGPIDILVQNGSSYMTLSVDYRGGPTSPHLQRIATAPNRLAEIIAPR